MSARYRIGRWEVDALHRTLCRDDESETLSPRAMDVLIHLAVRPGQVVPGSVLIQTFWPRAVTSPNAIQKIITELRHALHEGHDGHKYIETVPKRGYRLVAAVTPIEATRERSVELTTCTIGTRTTIIGPVDSDLLTANGRKFAQQIRRELIACLSQLPNVSMRTHTVPLQQIKSSNLANELRVDFAVEFNVQETDMQTVATVACTPGSKELPSLQEHFDSSAVPNERINTLVDGMAILLDEAHVQRMREWGARNVHAYRDAAEGDTLRRTVSFGGTAHAQELFQRALEKDPRFAMAYGSLAAGYHDMAMTAKDTASREHIRQQLQALHRKAVHWQVNPESIRAIERQIQYVSLANPFDAEVLWRTEIVKDRSNGPALRQYSGLLLGSKLIDEAAAYLARAIALTDQKWRDWVEQDEVNLAGARGEVERAIALMKRNLDRFPDHTMSTFGLVQTLAKHGKHAEAEFYLSRLVATDAPWAFFGKMMLMALRGDVRPGSNQLAHLFADPLANNTNRGFICFVVGDVEAGVRYWQEIEPGFLPMLWQFNVLNEGFWSPGVVNDERYQALLDGLGFGRQWKAYMRASAAELTPITGIQVTTSSVDQGIP